MRFEDIETRIASLHEGVAGQPEVVRDAMIRGYELSGDGQELLAALGDRALLTQLITSFDAYNPVSVQDESVESPIDQGKASEDVTETISDSLETTVEEVRVIELANQLHHDFIDLPQVHSVKKKHEDRRDRNFVLKGLQGLTFQEIEGERPNLLSQPHAIAKTLDTWIALAHDNGERSKALVDIATDALAEYAREHWAELPKATVAELLQETVHASMATAALEEIMAGYLRGPQNLADQVAMYADFCLTTQYLLEDQKAIDRLTQISSFVTDILPRRGAVHLAFTRGFMTVVDRELYVTARDASAALDGLHALSSFDASSRYWAEEKSLITLSPAQTTSQIRRLQQELNVSQAKAGEIFATRMTLLEAVCQEGGAAVSPAGEVQEVRDAYGSETADWYEYLKFGLSARRQEYLETFGYRANRKYQPERFDDNFGEIVDIVSLPLGDGSMLDIFIPAGQQFSREDYIVIREQTLKRRDEGLDDLDKPTKYFNLEAAILIFGVELDGQDIATRIRPSSKLDKLEEHELNHLLWEDLPDIESELFDKADEIAQRIDRYEQRYIGKRGIKTKFKSEEMVAAGFEEISIKEDPNNPNSLMVALQHRGQTLRYRINDRMQLDLESRNIHSDRLKDIIERRTLAVIEEWMTREVIETSEGTIRGGERGTTTRSGGLVYLPEGQNFRPKQWELYLKHRRKDLKVKSILRRPDDPTGKGRNTTYRQPTEVDDPNMEPVELYIDDVSIV